RFGYHGTTVRSIAAKAGLSVPGLYHHYPSKQEILATLLRMSNEDVMARSRAEDREVLRVHRIRLCGRHAPPGPSVR
ncbi:TetR/AcrR family transcriptional regulator, partial [Pseudonocardia sp. RS010]|uniref:TetR/AcrR family transcriptional regulator n=1 Tax=Pseudonocardia sp. RS010 TaxID=3385979 RepID=UPI00399EED13